MDKAISKYLSEHAEPETSLLSKCTHLHQEFGHTVIIPSCSEGVGIINTLNSVPSSSTSSVLTIVVINGRTDAVQQTHEQNKITRREIQRIFGTPTQSSDNRIEIFEHPAGQLCVVDRYSLDRRFATKEGVGLARKIGTDIAFHLWAQGRIQSPYLHCADADVLLPNDVFQQAINASSKKQASAIVFPFWHEPSPDTPLIRQANALYEIKLRYYVLGLRWAKSPYAFHTIGSTMAIHAHDYARVRGFPKRQAGEDFYLLNKLSKIHPVICSHGEKITIEGRVSERVPFGTGKSLLALSENPETPYPLYAPEVFENLQYFIDRVTEHCEAPTDILKALSDSHAPQPLIEAIQTLNLADGINENLSRGSTSPQRLKNFHTYFDAFRTLKLIHTLRDQHYPSPPVREALVRAPFVPLSLAQTQDLDEVRKGLMELE